MTPNADGNLYSKFMLFSENETPQSNLFFGGSAC